VGVLFMLAWFAFWIWVLKCFYSWVTRGIARAFSGVWASMFRGAAGQQWDRDDYDRLAAAGAERLRQPGPTLNRMTGDLEQALREEEHSATELARTIGEHRRNLRAFRNQADEWRGRAASAVGKGRDDLARSALGEAQRCDEGAAKCEALLGELQPILDSYEREIDQLRGHLDEGLRRQLVADARVERARAGQRAARWLSPDMQAQLDDLTDAAERKADLAEGQWQAQKMGGGFGRKGLPPAALPAPDLSIPSKTVERWDAAIERQLSDIKKRSDQNAA
jgi:phage shock protein A